MIHYDLEAHCFFLRVKPVVLPETVYCFGKTSCKCCWYCLTQAM